MKTTKLFPLVGVVAAVVAGADIPAPATQLAAPSLLQLAFPGVDPGYTGTRGPLGLDSFSLSYARTWGNPNGIEVVFSAAVDAGTATRTGNYAVAPGVGVTGAILGTNAWSVVLATTTMTNGATHLLTVNNVQDASYPPNTIPTNSQTAVLKAQGVITRKVFLNIGSNLLASLTNNAKFPNAPDGWDWPASFEAPSNQGDYYGLQMAGYVHPPVTGDYMFYLASDNQGLLYLSSDDNPANKAPIASVPDFTNPRQWNKYASQQSAYFHLEAGRAYYIEALMADTTGNDNLAVTWRLRGMPAPADGDAALPGAFLSSLTPSAAVSITAQPQGQAVPERQPAMFSVAPTGTPPYTYQWLRNGVQIPGATATNFTLAKVSLLDNGTVFSVIVSNSFSQVTSSNAMLTVIPDTTPPTLSRVTGGPTLDRVLLAFSEPVTPASAGNPVNYGLNGGLSVYGAEALPDGTNVVLTTGLQTPGQLYTVTATGVADVSAAHNVANTSSNFTAWVATRGFVRREVFLGISGSAISDLLNQADYPDNPDLAAYMALAEAPQNVGANCGQRLAGLLLPPTTGYYTFFFYSADQGALYLSPDENPANKAQIAYEPQWNSYRNWVGTDRRTAASPENRSLPIYLQAGQRYYFEAVMKDADGDNRLGVTWQLPGAPLPVNGDPPILAANLAAYASPVGAALSITQQPASVAVQESATASFTVGVTSSYAPVFYQWQKNGADIAGATNSALTTPRLLRTDSGSQFQCLASIPGASMTSAVATVTVIPDNIPPQAVSAATLVGSTNLGITFNELMDAASASNPANYSVSTGASVTGARLRPDGQSVSLALTILSFTNFTVTMNHLKDYAGNPLPADTAVNVAAVGMENTDIGTPGTDPVEIGSTFSSSPGNFDVSAGGSDIWNTRDGFHYVYRVHEGDFDARVRVARLDNKSTYTFAGLVARENLSPGSRNVRAHLFTTNGANGFNASSRVAQDGTTTGTTIVAGPVPYPNAWLRLTRTNDTFIAWRGTNGVDWTSYATLTLSFTGRIYVGMAACPVNNSAGQATTAWFRDFSLSPSYPLPGPLDLAVKKAAEPDTNYALNGIYQAFPFGPQALTQTATGSAPAAFTVRVDNDGATNQPLVLRAYESAETNWTVTYQVGGSNVSTLILSNAGYAISNLAPGGSEYVTVQMTPGPRLSGGATKSTRLTVATDIYTRSLRDAVRVVALNEINYQPDLLVRRLSDVVYAGDGVFNTTGLGQTKSITADAGALAVYPLAVVNAGNITNYFNLAGPAGGGGWSVRYFDALVGGNDITAEITGSGLPVALAPAASWEFRAEVQAGAAVPPGASNLAAVTATAVMNPARADTVKMITVAQIATNVPLTGVFASDAAWEQGILMGTVYSNNLLQLGARSVTWPYIWVPNSNEGTVSKVDTRTGRELARYRTCPAGVTGNPSRTTVDQYGNCWVANRQSGTVVKIGLLESGQYLDRNGNGVADTSQDLNGDGNITGSELLAWGQDECMLYEAVLIPGKEGTFTPGTYTNGYANNYWNPGPRGIAVDYTGNVWAGTHDAQKYYYLDGTTAQILRTNDLSAVNHSPYGAVIDGDGMLWSSGYKETGVQNLLRLNPTDNSLWVTNINYHPYGLGLDRSNHLFVSGFQEANLSRINTPTLTYDWTVAAGYQSRGVAVTDDGDVWVACSSEGTVWRFSNDGVFKGKITVGSIPTGVSVDAQGKVWVVNDGDEYIKRIDPAVGAFGTVDLVKDILGGIHYGYSDMTGIISRTATGRFGTWTIMHDAVVQLTQWGRLTWVGYEPSANSISIRVRSSNDRSRWANWEQATNGVLLAATPPGRYLQVEVTLRTPPTQPSPYLSSLTVEPLPQRTADLALAQSVTPNPATNEHLVTWSLAVTNFGPQDARGVFVTNVLPSGVTLVSVANSAGSLLQVSPYIRCDIGNLAAGSNFTMIISALLNLPGTLTNLAAVSHYEMDVVPANNVSALATLVLPNPCLAPPAGLASWWPGDGNPNDIAGTNNGAFIGGLTTAAGKNGLAFNFTTAGAYMKVPASASLNVATNGGVTLETWIKPSDINSQHPLLEWDRVNNNWGLHFWISVPQSGGGPGSLWANLIDTSGGTHVLSSSPGLVSTGAWSHVALTYDKPTGAARLYCNGTNVASASLGSFTPQTSSALNLGFRPYDGTRFAGLMDEVSIYGRALSAAEIFAIYDAGASGKCKAGFAPRVGIALAGGSGGTLTVSWPLAAGGFSLYYADVVTGPWYPELTLPVTAGDQIIVTVQATNSARFYRLRK